jgi:hypothetical protein
MFHFVRFDKSDYERLASRDRWSAGDSANIFINAKKDIDGSFADHYWRVDAKKACVELLTNEFLAWHKDKKLVYYGLGGDLCAHLKHETEYMSPYDDVYGVNSNDVYFMKAQILDLYAKYDAKSTKRINRLLEGKYWREPRADFTEEELFKILVRRVAEEFEDCDKTTTKDEIIRHVTRVGVGSDYGKTILYKWVGEVLPSK